MSTSNAPTSALQNQDWVEVGRLGAPHGVQGWIKLQSYTRPIENIFDYQPWYVNHQGHWQPIEVLAWREQGKGWIVQLANVLDRTEAAQYTQSVIAVQRAQLPEAGPEECYWHDLPGLTVVNEQGTVLGTVQQMRDIGAHGVMVVEDAASKRQHLIPFVRGHFILKVDLPAQTITVAWDADF